MHDGLSALPAQSLGKVQAAERHDQTDRDDGGQQRREVAIVRHRFNHLRGGVTYLSGDGVPLVDVFGA